MVLSTRPLIAGLFTRAPDGRRRQSAPGLRLPAAAGLAVLLLATACTGGSPGGSSGGSAAPRPAAWRVVWSDDFDGPANTALSRSDWIYSLGTGYPGGARQWGTNEIETMTDSISNVYHDGSGHLAIKPIRTGTGVGRWTSGRVETKRTDFAAPPGGRLRMEASLRQPDVTGPQAAGYWSAFWALGAGARPVGSANWAHIGEWDVMENVNGRDSLWQTLHCGPPVGGPCGEPAGISSGEQPCHDCRSAFHTYAIEYDRSVSPEQLRWYVDTKLTFSVAANRADPTSWANATQHGFFLILNVAVGGVFPANVGGGPSAQTRSGVPMLVDRVAVSVS